MPQNVAATPKKQRLSTPQTLHLMRIEVENALTHGYPISCMMFGLDGFITSDSMLHRKVVMPLVFQELKAVVFERKVRGLGIWTEGFQLAVFPHVGPDELQAVAEALLKRSHAVAHESVPADEPIALSIGISHNLHPGNVSFESIVEEAESGMGMALSAGGDQISQWRDVETELDRLKDELSEQLREIEAIQTRVFSDGASEEEVWGQDLVRKVIEIFQHEPDQNAGVVRLQQLVVELLKGELEEFKPTSSATQLISAQSQIEQLERRVNKLTNSLGRTESELKRVASMKDVDMGVASLYRTVQGLSADDDQVEAKHAMLKNIFEANVALRAEMAARK